MPRLSPDVRSILDAAPDAIVLIDDRGTVGAFNRAAEVLFGRSEPDVVGENVSILMPEPYRSEHDRYIQRYHETGEARIIGSIREVMAVDATGREFPIDISVGQFNSGQGPDRQYVGIIRDLSKLRAAEARLAEEEQLYRLAVEYAPQGLVTVDQEGRIQRFNRAFSRITLASPGVLKGKPCGELLHPDAREEYARWFHRTLDGSSNGSHFERRRFRLIRANGDICAVSLELGLVKNRKGGAKQVVIHVEDITEAERTRQVERHTRNRLAHGDRLSAMAEMTAGIAHELNQPLSAIGIYAQACGRLIRSENVETEEVLEVLGKIDAQAERAGTIISRLRNFVRKRESIRGICHLNELVRSIAELAAIDARRQDVRVQFDLDERLPGVMVDSVQIEQVVLNLIRNGVEATRERPAVIVVTTRLGEGEAIVSVRDHGVGLTPEQAAEIFNPFHTTKSAGMGIGLTICQTIVSAHGGRLTVTPNPDRGSTFSFALPLEKEGRDA